MYSPTRLLPLLALVVAGCTNPPAMMAQPDMTVDNGVQLAMAYSLEAGTEQHVCQFVKLPSSTSGEVLVTSLSHTYTHAHHWALIRSSVTEVPSGFSLDKPVDCFTSGIAQHSGTALFLGGTDSSSVEFPSGTALPFKPGEILVLQVHGLNSTAAKVTGNLTATLRTTTADKILHRLGMIQFYDPFIHVPANGTSTAHERCKVPSDITLLSMGTHFHTRGINEKVWVDLAGQAPATTPLVESTDWEHPNIWSGSMAIPAGSSVHFTCSYKNNESTPIYQGQDKGTNEMCMVVGFYYPALDAAFEGCFQPGMFSELGTGTKTCGELTGCIQQCPMGEAPKANGSLAIDVGPCWQRCMVDSCASASAPFLTLGACIEKNGLGGCMSELDTCFQHTCQ